jgi:hypothetical protein
MMSVSDGNALVRAVIQCVARTVYKPLRERIEALEESETIDAEVIDELGKCLERVDALEKGLEGRGLKFMGKWRGAAISNTTSANQLAMPAVSGSRHVTRLRRQAQDRNGKRC